MGKMLRWHKAFVLAESLQPTNPRMDQAYRDTTPKHLHATTAMMLANTMAMLSRWREEAGGWEALRKILKAIELDMKHGLIKTFCPQELHYTVAKLISKYQSASAGPSWGGKYDGRSAKPCSFFNKQQGCRMGAKCTQKHVCLACGKGGHGKSQCTLKK